MMMLQISENETSRKMYVSRDPRTGRRALQLANFQCELDSEHKTFISNTNLENYVEAHHLIPIKYYYSDEFKYSIDNDANIVALCPNCHNKKSPLKNNSFSVDSFIDPLF